MTPSAEIEPGPHWWKASALTTRPTLPPRTIQHQKKNKMQQSNNNNKNEALIQLKISYSENERTIFSIVVTGKNEATENYKQK